MELLMPGSVILLVLLFGVGIFVLWVAAIVSILRNPVTEPNTKLLWVLIVVLLPVLGPILYFVLGRKPYTARS